MYTRTESFGTGFPSCAVSEALSKAMATMSSEVVLMNDSPT
jgi:hypothetical protein